MNRFPVVYALFGALLFTAGCSRPNRADEYSGLEYRGGRSVAVHAFSETDTLRIAAGPTSLDGEWILADNKLLFLDNYMVGVREYDMEGHFIARYITRGRGPNEMLSPAYVATLTTDGDLVMLDSSWWIYAYDSLYYRKGDPYPFLSDIPLKRDDWMQLLHKPDPRVNYMYEFNANVRRIKVADSLLVMPVITEHVLYNGYEAADNARKFWSEAFNFIFVDLKNRCTGNLFGSYPPLYRRRNIPVFSKFDFDADVRKGDLYVGYAADSLIYIRSLTDGTLKYSFGCGAEGVSSRFPETRSFGEYEKVYEEHMAKYGYYTRLIRAGEYLFRGYKKEQEVAYGLQIYHDKLLIGDIAADEPVEVIGRHDGWFYGVLPADMDNECFRILKFRL